MPACLRPACAPPAPTTRCATRDTPSGGYAGPTLLVALTESGEIFGAYIDTPLKASDKYGGGPGCFLFTLTPHFHIFRPTAISKNYVLFNP